MVTAITAILLRTTRPDISLAVTVAGSVIVLLFSIDLLSSVFGIFTEIGEKTGIDNALIKIILKIVAVGYLVEFAAGIVEDFGAKSVADKLVFAGKIVIFSVSVPIVRALITLIGGFLHLI